MVVVKYKKINEGMFFSHLNMLRLWNRILSISDVDVHYSEGFNKTRRLFFSSPTRVGIESLCEYIVIDTDEKAKHVKAKIENNLPVWMEIEKVYSVSKKFNIAALNNASYYSIKFDNYKSCKVKINEFFEQDSIIIPVILHGEQKYVEVKDRIYYAGVEDDHLVVMAGVGEKSVRIDELVKKLLEYLGKPNNNYSVMKEVLYHIDENNEFIDIDDMADDIVVDD